jgi:hypothetical protein
MSFFIIPYQIVFGLSKPIKVRVCASTIKKFALNASMDI